MNLNLTGKKALVCGSTQGIGKAVAEELASMGASIILIARDETKLRETRKLLDTSKGQDHHYIVADFDFPPEVLIRVTDYLAENGPVHILVNNTGGPPSGPANTAHIDDFIHAFNQHLVCNHILVQAVIEGMKAEKYGRIINIISTSVKQPLPNLGVSNTIRGAVANWSKTLANELGQFNITVNNVLPGATNTQRLTNIAKNKAEKTGVKTQEVLDHMAAEVPMKRIAQPEEIAAAVAFLASPAASYINGINIPVDGGRTGSL
ncbi:MAG: SDR family oxidoreductase [Flavobacteriales bacterium]